MDVKNSKEGNMSNLFKDDDISEMVNKYEQFEKLMNAFIELHKDEDFDNEENNRCKKDEFNDFCERVLEQFKEDIKC